MMWLVFNFILYHYYVLHCVTTKASEGDTA